MTTDPKTTLSENGNAAAAKKKRNRKKKKKAASAEETPPPPASPKISSMNPQLQLRHRVMKEAGITDPAIVDQALEDMWNQNLPYDDYAHVLHFVKTGKKLPPPVDSDDEEKGNGKKKTKKKDKQETATASNNPSEATTPAAAPKVKAASSSKMTMADKLDMVASFDNMTDAIFALTEWVNKAAKVEELQELCTTNTTLALVTIYRRSITESTDASLFESTTVPAMCHLMTSLLQRCGISSSSLSFGENQTTERSLELLLKQARRVHVLLVDQSSNGSSNNSEFGDRVSRFIVSRISLAVEEATNSAFLKETKGGTNKGGGILGKSSEHQSSSSSSSSMEWFAKREAAMVAAKRSAAQAVILCNALASSQTSSNGDVVATPTATIPTATATIDKGDILLALVGEDAEDQFNEEKVQLDQLKQEQMVNERENGGRLVDLRASLTTVTSEQEPLAAQITALQTQLAQLQSQEGKLQEKSQRLEEAIAYELESGASDETTTALNHKVDQAAKAVKYGASMRTLVDVLKKYDESLDQAIQGAMMSAAAATATSKKNENDDQDDAAAAYSCLDTFLSRSDTYFAAEAECKDFLIKRIATSKQDAIELASDIADCRGLGMTTTIGEMEKSQLAKEELAKKDAVLLERVQKEAVAMFAALIERLQQYATTMEGQEDGKKLFEPKLLDTIPKNASRLGVENAAARLKPFLGINKISKTPPPTKSTPPPAPEATKSAPHVAAPPAPSSAAPTADPVKFTWAAQNKKPANGSDKGISKKTLLEIQKEEIQSRDTESSENTAS